jgi:[glutamine synthetase] adenylyltransferase / [glutamine synthetase]-adenylyl-L-tyrosine phosphorylase
MIQGGPHDGSGRARLIILALGKLGGREPNYHSDLDVVFLYEADGDAHPRGSRSDNRPPTSTSSANWASGSSR